MITSLKAIYVWDDGILLFLTKNFLFQCTNLKTFFGELTEFFEEPYKSTRFIINFLCKFIGSNYDG